MRIKGFGLLLILISTIFILILSGCNNSAGEAFKAKAAQGGGAKALNNQPVVIPSISPQHGDYKVQANLGEDCDCGDSNWQRFSSTCSGLTKENTCGSVHVCEWKADKCLVKNDMQINFCGSAQLGGHSIGNDCSTVGYRIGEISGCGDDYKFLGCSCIDKDGDGFSSESGSACSKVGGDCNDNNPRIHPLASEILNDGVDSNCRGGDNA